MVRVPRPARGRRGCARGEVVRIAQRPTHVHRAHPHAGRGRRAGRLRRPGVGIGRPRRAGHRHRRGGRADREAARARAADVVGVTSIGRAGARRPHVRVVRVGHRRDRHVEAACARRRRRAGRLRRPSVGLRRARAGRNGGRARLPDRKGLRVAAPRVVRVTSKRVGGCRGPRVGVVRVAGRRGQTQARTGHRRRTGHLGRASVGVRARRAAHCRGRARRGDGYGLGIQRAQVVVVAREGRAEPVRAGVGRRRGARPVARGRHTRVVDRDGLVQPADAGRHRSAAVRTAVIGGVGHRDCGNGGGLGDIEGLRVAAPRVVRVPGERVTGRGRAGVRVAAVARRGREAQAAGPGHRRAARGVGGPVERVRPRRATHRGGRRGLGDGDALAVRAAGVIRVGGPGVARRAAVGTGHVGAVAAIARRGREGQATGPGDRDGRREGRPAVGVGARLEAHHRGRGGLVDREGLGVLGAQMVVVPRVRCAEPVGARVGRRGGAGPVAGRRDAGVVDGDGLVRQADPVHNRGAAVGIAVVDGAAHRDRRGRGGFSDDDRGGAVARLVVGVARVIRSRGAARPLRHRSGRSGAGAAVAERHGLGDARPHPIDHGCGRVRAAVVDERARGDRRGRAGLGDGKGLRVTAAGVVRVAAEGIAGARGPRVGVVRVVGRRGQAQARPSHRRRARRLGRPGIRVRPRRATHRGGRGGLGDGDALAVRAAGVIRVGGPGVARRAAVGTGHVGAVAAIARRGREGQATGPGDRDGRREGRPAVGVGARLEAHHRGRARLPDRKGLRVAAPRVVRVPGERVTGRGRAGVRVAAVARRGREAQAAGPGHRRAARGVGGPVERVRPRRATHRGGRRGLADREAARAGAAQVVRVPTIRRAGACRADVRVARVGDRRDRHVEAARARRRRRAGLDGRPGVGARRARAAHHRRRGRLVNRYRGRGTGGRCVVIGIPGPRRRQRACSRPAGHHDDAGVSVNRAGRRGTGAETVGARATAARGRRGPARRPKRRNAGYADRHRGLVHLGEREAVRQCHGCRVALICVPRDDDIHDSRRVCRRRRGQRLIVHPGRRYWGTGSEGDGERLPATREARSGNRDQGPA